MESQQYPLATRRRASHEQNSTGRETPSIGGKELAEKNGQIFAARMYGVSRSSVKRSSVKRWSKRYDGTWQSLKERSHRPKRHPREHTEEENSLIAAAFSQKFERYGWVRVFDEAISKGYTRSLSGLIHAAKRQWLRASVKKKKRKKSFSKYPELLIPGEKVQVDVKEVPYCCLSGEARKYGKRFYQWTAIDECTRYRFIYAFEEHTPENSVKFLKILAEKFPFKMQTIQTDNGTEFTYKYLCPGKECPFDGDLQALGINHKLIPPRSPWKNGKIERSPRSDQHYFYDWEAFLNIDQLNIKLAQHLILTNNKTMRILGNISPSQKLAHII